MRWTTQAAAGLVAIALAACGGGRSDQGAGATGGTAGSGTETGAMSDTTRMGDTGAMPADTGTSRDSLRMQGAQGQSDTAAQNQTQTGVTDSAGGSTLGTSAEKTRPDQGQPVTSKGDTINRGVDSVDSAR